MSQGQPGCQRSPASPSWGDEKAVPGNRMTTAAGSQLCALLSWLAWVPLLQIPLLTAGGVQPLWDMLYCDAFRHRNSANNQLLALEEQGECNFFFFSSFLLCPVDEEQPIFLTYLKTLILLSVTVFHYLPQLSSVIWKSPTVFVGPRQVKASLTQGNIYFLLIFALVFDLHQFWEQTQWFWVCAVCTPEKEEVKPLRQSSSKRIAKEDWEPCISKQQKIRR